jgi:hypothetical protein
VFRQRTPNGFNRFGGWNANRQTTISTETRTGKGGSMLHDRNGQTVVEYIVVLAIFIALVGGALWEVFTTLQVKFNDVNAEIGS